MACFLDPSFKSFTFISQATTVDSKFKRNFLNDLDNWLLAEIEPIASKLIANAQNHANESQVQHQTTSPATPSSRLMPKRMRFNDDPFDELRNIQSANIPSCSLGVIINNAEKICKLELLAYKQLSVSSTDKNHLLFWKENASDFPILSQTAKRLLCVSTSSAQSERDFSSVGQTITNLRSQLSAKKVEAIELVRGGLRAGLLKK